MTLIELREVQRYIGEDDERDRFRAHIGREADRVREEISRLDVGPLCGLAFLYVDEDDVGVGYAYACTSKAREALLEASDDPDGAPVWQPADWDIELGASSPDAVTGAESVALARRFREIDWPAAEPFLRDLCLHLNRSDWTGIAGITDDFVAWPNDHELTALDVEDFLAIAPEAVGDVYQKRGWLRWFENIV